jgi:ArsR family transcriptional regulator, arsenate/arsenite/antimonite-responsive transcriptional repressor
MKNKTFLFDLEIFFMALADKTRLRLLNLMRGSEVSVGLLVSILGESQPKVSRHLAYLRSAGIVQTRRDGKWIYYKIIVPDDEFAARILSNTIQWLYSQEAMQEEYNKFSQSLKFNVGNEYEESLQAVDQNIFDKTDMKRKHTHEMEVYLL